MDNFFKEIVMIKNKIKRLCWYLLGGSAALILWALGSYMAPISNDLVTIPPNAWVSKSGFITGVLLLFVIFQAAFLSYVIRTSYKEIKVIANKPSR